MGLLFGATLKSQSITQWLNVPRSTYAMQWQCFHEFRRERCAERYNIGKGYHDSRTKCCP